MENDRERYIVVFHWKGIVYSFHQASSKVCTSYRNANGDDSVIDKIPSACEGILKGISILLLSCLARELVFAWKEFANHRVHSISLEQHIDIIDQDEGESKGIRTDLNDLQERFQVSRQ